jgi:hypothetical protein
MANPTMNDGSTTLTFRAGCIQARRLPYIPRQRKLVSSNGDVRILEVSAVDEKFIEIDVVSLPRADEGSYDGRDSLLAFIQDDLNWAENTFTFTDADSDSSTVRYWSDDFLLEEAISGRRKDSYDGKILLRVEAP